MKQFILSIALVFTGLLTFAQNMAEEHKILSKEAEELFLSGDFQSASEKYSQLLSVYPQNVEFNYKFGVCSVNNGSSPNISIRHLEFACKEGAGAEAYFFLGKAYHRNYDFQEAIDAFKKFKSKADVKTLALYDVDQQISMCTNGMTLMKNIKDLVVMDKKQSGEEDFFRFYELAGMGGKLLSVPEELKSKYDKKINYNGVLFYNGKSSEVYFASYGVKGETGKDIYKALILPNGKYSTAQKLPAEINTPYDEDFPFVHPDGKSLYFSSTGHSSMGGYDVFRSDFDANTSRFGFPVNLDFAVNTPDDDILYVTDSLHEEAWFASGRNIATGKLNIYNVRVKGIPMNLTFLKGDFMATFDSNLKDAHILVRDELTGMEVSEVFTDSETGEYVISLYKPGLYKFEVTAEGSPIVHEGLVKIPPAESSVAYAQELQLIKESGKEKLIIHNNFDTPLDEDIAQLSKDILRKKSSLDINADQMDFEKPEEQEPVVTIDKVISNATMAAGFAEGTEIKTVVNGAQDDISKIRDEIQVMADNNTYAYAYAVEMQEEAKAKMQQSQALRDVADPSNASEYANKMIQADKLLLEADELSLNSKAAMRIAERASDLSELETNNIDEIEKNIVSIIEGELNQDFDKATTALRWEKDRLNAKKGVTATTPGEMAVEESMNVEDRQTELLKSINSLSMEETSLLNLIERNQENISKEKKKTKIEALEAQNAQMKADLNGIQLDLASKRKEAQMLGKEQKLLSKEAEFYANQYIVPDKINLSPIKLDGPDLVAINSEFDDLDEDIEGVFQTRNIERSQDDYVIRGTKFDSDINTSLAEVNSAKKENNSGKTEKEKSKKEKINQVVEIQSSIVSLEEQIENYNSGNTAGISDEDFASIKRDLTSKKSKKAELKYQMDYKSMNDEELMVVYNEIEPNYRTEIQTIINESDNELEQSVKIREYKKGVRDEMSLINDQLKRRMLTETDQSELAKIIESNYKYDEAFTKLNDEIYSVDPIKAAFESENKNIVESEEVIAIKLNDQIALTDRFIKSLDEVIEATNSELAETSDVEQRGNLERTVKELEDERSDAVLKLNNYQEDLSLTTSANEGPGLRSNVVKENTDKNPESTNPKKEDEIITPINGGSFNEIFADAGMVKPEDSYFTEEYYEFSDKTIGTRWEIDNVAELEKLDEEIFNLEEQHKNSSTEEEKEALDKKIENKFVELSKLELRNYAKVHHLTDEEMKSNARIIDSLKTAYSGDIKKTVIKNELKKLTKEIDTESDELERKRNDLPEVADDIEQAFIAREAFGLETSIIRKQRKMIAFYENTDQLNALDDSDIAKMNSGRYGIVEEPEVLIVLNKDVEIDWALIEKQGGIDGFDGSEMIADLQDKSSLSSKDAAYIDQLRVVELRLSEQSKLLTDRDELRGELSGVEAKIEELQFRLANTKKKKDREVIEAEIKMLRAKADVLYEKINYLTDQISENNKDIEEMLAGGEDLASIDVTEKFAEQEKSEKKTDVTIDAEIANNEKSITDTKKATDKVGNNNAVANDSRKAEKSTANLNIGVTTMRNEDMFNFPDVLTSDIFNMHPGNMEDKEIPTDVKLPSGTVYKVQVGAFRNPIRSAVFSGFSPVTGEALSNGITRYTAGLFLSYSHAEEAKQAIRKLGYSDAFIVKFIDGKRVSISGTELNATNEVIVENTTQPTNKTNVIKKTGDELLDAVKSDATGEKAKDYYKSFEGAAEANMVEGIKGVFFTVQIGVYSRPVPSSELKNVSPLNADMLPGGKYRYSTGIYDDLEKAIQRREVVRASSFSDAFVTAYNSGQRITVALAKELLSSGSNKATPNTQPEVKVEKTSSGTPKETKALNPVVKSEMTETRPQEKVVVEKSEAGPAQAKTEKFSMEMETPVVVRTTVKEKSDGPQIKMILMEYDVLLYSSVSSDVSEPVLKAIDNIGEEWNIKVVQKGDKTLVYTKRVNSLQEARNMQNQLDLYGVNDSEIRAFRVE